MATIDLSGLSTGNPTVISGLRKAVAQAYGILALSHNLHINVTGSDFYQLHLATDSIYKDSLEVADKLAERVRALDAPCHICLSELDNASGLPCLPLPFAARDGVNVLINGLNIVIRDTTALINLSDSVGDKVTSNILQEVVGSVQKSRWMLRAWVTL